MSKMRIEKNVFFEVLNALRDEVKINVKHPSFSANHMEASHIVSLLEKALFVESIQKGSITIQSNKHWHSRKNENIWDDFSNRFPVGTEISTHVQRKVSTITKWKTDEVIYYSNSNLLKKITKDEFISIAKNKLSQKLENISATEKRSIVNSRIGQDVLRKLMIEVYNNSCSMCEINVPKLLRTSHIIKWSEDKTNRLNPNNILCLCSLHDLAFENGIVAISDNYEILINSDSNEVLSLLKQITFDKLQLPINNKFLPDKKLLSKHREINFIGL